MRWRRSPEPAMTVVSGSSSRPRRARQSLHHVAKSGRGLHSIILMRSPCAAPQVRRCRDAGLRVMAEGARRPAPSPSRLDGVVDAVPAQRQRGRRAGRRGPSFIPLQKWLGRTRRRSSCGGATPQVAAACQRRRRRRRRSRQPAVLLPDDAHLSEAAQACSVPCQRDGRRRRRRARHLFPHPGTARARRGQRRSSPKARVGGDGLRALANGKSTGMTLRTGLLPVGHDVASLPAGSGATGASPTSWLHSTGQSSRSSTRLPKPCAVREACTARAGAGRASSDRPGTDDARLGCRRVR